MRQERKNEILGLTLLAVTVLIFVSLISFNPQDIALYTSTPNKNIANFAGIIGAYISGILFFLIGRSAFLIPLLTLSWAVAKFFQKEPQRLFVKASGTLIAVLAMSSLLSNTQAFEPIGSFKLGGLLGFYFSKLLFRYFSKAGSYIILAALFALSILIATEFLIVPFMSSAARFLTRALFKFFNRLPWGFRKKRIVMPKPFKKAAQARPSGPIFTQIKKEEPRIRIATQPIKPRVEMPKEKALKTERPKPVSAAGYQVPSLELLDSPPPISERKIKDDLEQNSRILEETLRDFGIETRVTQVERGPTITRYELEPAPGVKLTRITSLSDDIALAMKALSVRVIAPIPGKGCVGIEIPNSQSALVYLKEVLESDDFKTSGSKLALALGKDVAGQPLIADLAGLPHLLIAGTTGSGKTVCVNSIISGLLFNFTPDEIKFVMVDPKMVELAIFNDLPHLLCPVVTEPRKVSGALNWVVEQMEERYRQFAKLGARNIDIYNEKVEKDERLPYILVIIDELADLMAVASDDIENAITRLAQLSRAVGIHIILATQRPSVDVITGIIKANFPARVSFKVATKVDSRTVLDMNGSEKLLGRGDMLFLKPGFPKPIRAQGSLVSDKEIERVVNFIKSQRTPEYHEEILEKQAKTSSYRNFEKDELFDEAVKVILETGQASVSILQRRMRLGYTRAARLIDAMEQEGIIGPFRGPKPREILISRKAEPEVVDET